MKRKIKTLFVLDAKHHDTGVKFKDFRFAMCYMKFNGHKVSGKTIKAA